MPRELGLSIVGGGGGSQAGTLGTEPAAPSRANTEQIAQVLRYMLNTGWAAQLRSSVC